MAITVANSGSTVASNQKEQIKYMQVGRCLLKSSYVKLSSCSRFKILFASVNLLAILMFAL